MPEVFTYPMSYPSIWLDYYYLATWFLSMLFLAAVWAVFFRYGKFSYGVDLGCFWKTALLVLCTTVSLGAPMYYNTRFAGEHGQDGDSLKIVGDKLLYSSRNGTTKQFKLSDITAIRQEVVTYNPPAKIYVVAKTTVSGRDSLFVTTALPEYKRLLDELSKKSGIAPKLQ